ncbi:MAG: biotin--[acetyl-CoA-carboxylase] ligase [Bacteroidota bacterium]
MKTLFIGQNAIFLKSIDSTNSYAIELMRQNNLADGSIIYTFEQTKGRGQRGNEWASEPNKNIALSLVLYPSFLSTMKQFLLAKITAIAIADLMAELLCIPKKNGRIQIKWPNDIYIDDKKIAGILIENSIRDANIQSSVIGVGINVNQIDFIPTLNATSMKMIAEQEFDLNLIVARFCSFFESRYLQLITNKLTTIDSEYLEKLYRLNKWNQFASKNDIFKGRIKGVTEFGKLQLELESTEIREYDLKEIGFI